MGVRLPSTSSILRLGNIAASGAENLITLLPPLNIPLDFAPILLVWFLSFAVGTGVTALNVQLRRGNGLTGTSIGNLPWTQSVTASTTVSMGGMYVDTPGAVAGMQYSLTASATGATGVSTLQDVCLLGFVL